MKYHVQALNPYTQEWETQQYAPSGGDWIEDYPHEFMAIAAMKTYSLLWGGVWRVVPVEVVTKDESVV